MKIIECFINQSNWLKQETRKIRPMGVLWHSTGANNTNIKRYVQPDDNAANRDELISIIAKNRYSNDWNHLRILWDEEKDKPYSECLHPSNLDHTLL